MTIVGVADLPVYFPEDLEPYDFILIDEVVASGALEASQFLLEPGLIPMVTTENYAIRGNILGWCTNTQATNIGVEPVKIIDGSHPLAAGSTENLFRFGDLGSSKVGTLYDWLIWDVSGAYPPETGTPIPQELLDTGSMSTGISEVIHQPAEFQLAQNYPNPFNPSTEIVFSLRETAHTTLTVFNALGQQVFVLINKTMHAGQYHTSFNAENYPAGVYYNQLKSGSSVDMKKMVILK